MSYPDEPACWSWPIPTGTRDDELARLFAINDALPYDSDDRGSHDAIEMMLGDWDYYRFGEFHSGQCAMCGRVLRLGGLVEDHDHWTGLVRGLLCRSCNRQESVPGRAAQFAPYRQRNPATILECRRYYEGVTWPYGWWKNERLARHLTGNPNWTRESAGG